MSIEQNWIGEFGIKRYVGPLVVWLKPPKIKVFVTLGLKELTAVQRGPRYIAFGHVKPSYGS